MFEKMAFELVVKSLDETGQFVGYANVYGVKDLQNEIIESGAFNDSIGRMQASGRMPALLWQHRSDSPIGVITSLSEDNNGLVMVGKLLVDDVQQAREAHALLKAGAINGLSVGFERVDSGFDKELNARRTRKANLWEVSIVTFPANDKARVSNVKTILEDEKERVGVIAMPEQEPITELQKVWEEYKKTNDERLAEIEKKGHAVADHDEKLARMDTVLDAIKKSIDTTKAILPGTLHMQADSNKTRDEHKAAFMDFVRKGRETGLSEIEKKAYNITTGSDGGYAVPEEIDRNIQDLILNISPIRSIANVITVGTSDYKKLVNTHGTTSGWVGEATARTAGTSSSLAEVTAVMGEIYCNIEATQQMLDDVFFNAEAWITSEIAAEQAQTEGTAFVTGSGTLQPKGFASYTTAATADGTRAFGSIQHIATGTSAAYKTASASVNPADDLYTMIYATKPQHRTMGTFVMNAATLGTVRKWKEYSTGGYIWQPNLVAGQPSTLCGYSVVEAEDVAASGAGALTIFFGNFKAGYTIVDRIGARMLRDPYSNKPYVGFYVTKRVGGMVVDSEAIKCIKQAAS